MAAFFSTVGRIFVQEGGTWTPWVSYLRKEADYLEGGSNCGFPGFLGPCQQAWHRGAE